MKRVVYVFRVFVLSEMAERKCCVKGCGRNKWKNKEASFFSISKSQTRRTRVNFVQTSSLEKKSKYSGC